MIISISRKRMPLRVYGLELEELLSPNAINFLIWGDTLIEEHIIGVPGDQFIKEYLTEI
ncbi:MAG: hypothetical protein ACJZ9L_00185 [Coraliomargaritaceae bacterium]